MGFKMEYFPISIGYIAGILNRFGYDAKIFNAELSSEKNESSYTPAGRMDSFNRYKKNLNGGHAAWDELHRVIEKYKPKIIGISSCSATHSSAKRVSEIAKTVGIRYVVVGGPYPTLQPEQAIQDKYIDYVVSGEGEYTMLELTNYLLKNQGSINEINGISYQNDSGIISTPKRNRITNLDELPFIDYDLLINKESCDISRAFTLMGSRGCPYRCAFCAIVPLWGRKVVYRSIQSLLDEIEWNVGRYKITKFRFLDDTFTSNPSMTVEFCNQFIRRGLHKKLYWGCLSRVNVINPELVSALEKANCRSIALGIESGSDKILKTLKKSITTDLVREKTNLIKKSKLLLHMYFMIGTPHETELDIIKTCEFIKELLPDSINVTKFTPYYGTELYDYCLQSGLLSQDLDTSFYDDVGHHNKYNYFCPQIPKTKYFELVDLIMEISKELSKKWSRKRVLDVLRKGKYYVKHPIRLRTKINTILQQ